MFIVACLFIIQSCDTSTSASDSPASEEKQFVWNGLNFWYFWQDRVADLADDRKDNTGSFNRFLNGFDDERELFDHLIFDQEDRFSWFIDDYEVHEAARIGDSKSFGFRFGLAAEVGSSNSGSDKVFGYVQYVVEDSPADRAGLKRGDIFRGINGQEITRSNVNSLLSEEEYNLQMATVRIQGNGYRIENKDETVQIISEEIRENPIHTYRMYNIGGNIVGYLLYNSFRFNFHEELNDVFGVFKHNHVNELVLDLRYNGGGALITSALLASMISGVSGDEIFAELTYSNKRSLSNRPFPFYEKLLVFDDSGREVSNDTELNSLGLSRLYVLTSRNTASASETLMNGLLPYGVELIVIGETTAKKDEGSITVYDAPGANYSPGNNQRSMINPRHKRAMQPIVFKIFNSAGQAYPNGFSPTMSESEFNYLEGGLPPLGNQEEQLFKAALGHITGTFLPKEMGITRIEGSQLLMDSSELNPFHDEFYLMPADLDRLSLDLE